MQIELKKRGPLNFWQSMLLPISALIVAFMIGSILIAMSGANIWDAYLLLIEGAVGSPFALLETLLKMTPLCLTGLAVAVAFKGNFWNIGAEGQLYFGALVAALLGIVPGLPAFIHIPIIIIGGFIAGGLWAMLPAFLKVRFRVDDVVTTLMLNYVMIFAIQGILDGYWRDKVSGWPHSPEVLLTARYPQLLPESRFHLGFIVAIICAVLIYLLLRYTTLGYKIRATGLNPKAAAFGGINVKKTVLIVALISGGLAGLAGVGEVIGMQYYLVDGISRSYGYVGIAVALLANLNPLGVIFSSFFLAAIFTGSQTMSRFAGVPVYFSEFMQGLTLIVMLIALLFSKYSVRIRRS